jgi:hypothetical protein
MATADKYLVTGCAGFLAGLRSAPPFRSIEADLTSAALDSLLGGVDVVFG